MSLKQQLLILGLSEKESSVYLELVQTGKTTAHLLSKRLKIPRTTAYWALDSLVSRGLASIEHRKNTTFYAPNQPEALSRMVEEERRRSSDLIQQKQNTAIEIAQEIRPFFQRQGLMIPRIQFFEGEEGVRALLYDHTLKWQKSIEQYDNTWWGYQDHTFAETYLDWLEYTWKMKRQNEHYKIVTNTSEIEQKLAKVAPSRRMKFIQQHLKFSSTTWVVGDYIVLIMTSQKPHYAFQLHNALFAQNIRSVFQMLWEKAL